MAIGKCAGRSAFYPTGDCTPVFDHIAVWARDTEATSRFLTTVMGWKRSPTVIRVSDEEKTTGGMIGTFYDAPGLWIELIEPTTPGPGKDILDERGDGALVEINFDLGDSYGLALDRLAQRGVEMLSMDGSPLKDGGTIDEGVFDGEAILDGGQRIAYFPTELTHGTTIEYYEVLAANEGSLILERDRAWQNETRASGTPRVDHVTIVTDDAKRAATFFIDYMGMKSAGSRDNADGSKSILLDAVGADEDTLWLRLLEPAAGSKEAETLAVRGAGHIMELGVVVDDIAAFQHRVAEHGISLIDKQGQPLVASQPAVAEAYFRPEDSFGIPIRLVTASAVD